MDVTHLLDSLNNKQRQAVSAPIQNMLVLAGAGSGKTRVLVHRIAWLIAKQVPPHNILAVTFTNKAAAEMRSRVAHITNHLTSGMWIGTFHGLAHKFLRMHYTEANLPQSFQILDADDQLKMLKRVTKSLDIDEKRYPVKPFQWFINSKKDEGLRAQHLQTHDPHEQQMINVYQHYQAHCERAGLVDFAEILLRTHETLRDNESLKVHYQQKFKHILVDEFQDTNTIQYAWLRLLTGDQAHMMAVGDDDQSIYGWRGAKIGNLKHFLTDFPQASTLRLEQNYRSTANILTAANALIVNNSGRLGKELWTEGQSGEKISIYTAFNDLEEARFIASKLKQWQEHGNMLIDSAILYRNNAQSRLLEEALLQQSLPYRIYGGLRFFDRQEIKDTLAYLRLIANRDDDAAFERVINTPSRGIGDRSMQLIRDCARDQGATLYQAARHLLEYKDISGRAANAVRQFLQLLDDLEEQCIHMELDVQTDRVIKGSGLKAMYQAEKGEKGRTRIENLEELVTACKQYQPMDDLADMDILDAFLAHAALETGDSQADEFDDAVQLMTLHSAKGLEFPLVFITGVEEGMFPSIHSGQDIDRLEEERRLCYVGITRAKQKLYLTHSESRRLYGQEKRHMPSRFIRELPANCIEEIRLNTQIHTSDRHQHHRFSQTSCQTKFNQSGLQLGQRVRHAKFGEGVILNYHGSGNNIQIEINFDQVGQKVLMLSYAKLEPI